MAARLGQLCPGVDPIERGHLAMAGSKRHRCRSNKKPANENYIVQTSCHLGLSQKDEGKV